MTKDERAIRELVATWMRATKQGDIDTVLGLMTDDVVFMVAGHPPFGKKEFAASVKAMAGMSFEGKSQIEEIEVFGDRAWMRARIQMTMTAKGRAPVRRSGHTLSILRKEGGRWLLARDANLVG